MTLSKIIKSYKTVAESGVYEKVFYVGDYTEIDTSTISWTGDATVEVKATSGDWTTVSSGDSLSSFVPTTYLAVRITLERKNVYTSPEVTDASVTLEQEGTTVFSGVVGIPTSPEYSTGFESDIYSLEVQSINAILRRRLISEAWQDKTTPEIVQDIFDKYIADEGVTLGKISDINFTYTYYVAQREYVGDVLDALMSTAGATWHISPEKKFYFITKDDFTTVDAPTHISSVQKETSGIDTRTVQVIANAYSRTDTQTETFTWTDNQSTLTVGFELVEAPTIYINGVSVGVGVKGIESEDTSKTFFWSNESQTISLNSNADTQPEVGDTITVKYVGIYEIEIEEQNADKINYLKKRTGTSGRIEKVNTDSDIQTYADGHNLAIKLLDQFEESNDTITCVVDSLENTDLLTIWNFNLPDYHIEGDYLVTKRVIEKNKITVTLNSKQYYMKYGTIYNGYDKNIRSLSVNASTVIIKVDANDRTIDLSESWEQAGLVFYPTSSDFSDPTSLFYPMEIQA